MISTVRMMLADYAVVADGKLTVVGGGWTTGGPGPLPMSIAMLLEADWTPVPVEHQIDLRCVDADGHPVMAPDGTPLRFSAQLVTVSNDHVDPGQPTTIPLAVPVGPLVFAAGAYSWRLEIDGETRDDWRLSFSVRSAVPGA